MGALRLFLALSVVAGHTQSTVFGYHGIGAWYAVNFFFIISGFYMSMVLNEKYRDVNPILFYKSRVLRLFPVYYVGILISLVVSFDMIANFWASLSGNMKFFFVFQNLFVFGQDLSYLVTATPVGFSINPPAWSLAVELGFYFVAPYIVKEPKRLFLFILFGSVYLMAITRLDFPIDAAGIFASTQLYHFNYYFYPSSFVFFGCGALTYHLSKGNLNVSYLTMLLLVFLLSFTKTEMPFWHLFFVCLAIPPLFKITSNNRVDRIIGELSYPAYILHFPILRLLMPFTKTHPQYFDFLTLGSSVAIIACALGLFLYFFAEKRINSYRHSKIFLRETGTLHKKSTQILATGLVAVYFIFPMASVVYIHASQSSSVRVHALTSYNLTDANWVNGVARDFAGFFVQNSRQHVDYFKPGKELRFANGDLRKINEAKEVGSYLNVFVEGAPLDGELVGFPHEIKVVE